jgi:hypothetical protein
MGRPRKAPEDRLSRAITARLGDAQYDWLVERATDERGDMSEALREAIDAARVFYDLLAKADPPEALREFLLRSEEEQVREEAWDED